MYKKEKQLFQRDPHPEIRFPGRGGGGVGELPMMAYAGGSTRKGYLFGTSPRVYERLGISSWSIKKGYGNLSFVFVKGLTDEFYGFMKSVDSYLKYSAFKQGMWKRYHLSI